MRSYRFPGLIALLFLCASTASAQGIVPTDDLSISVSPEHPRPYQTVTIRPASTLVDLAASTITISVNGSEVERGSGAVVGYARMGAAGTRSTITVTMTNNGRTYQEQLVLIPADVSLIVEPISTTHPFYKGSGLLSSEGRVRLIAVADVRTSPGAQIAPQNLIYTWRVGNRILESSSGIGRFTLDTTAPVRYRDAVVSVTASTQDNAIVAYAQTLVSPIDPVLRIYRYDPLLGPLYDWAQSGAVTMINDEETYRVVPYHFPSKPSVAWTVNSVEGARSNDITVRSTGNGSGSALLSVTAKGTGLFQSANSSLNVRFGESRPFGIFGL